MRLLFEIDKKDYDPEGEVFRRPSSRGIIFRGGKLSVIYSRKHKYCKLPGGGIEAGEDSITALIREVREETGLVVKPETVREFGYVHRIQRGKHEPVFIQDNFYYLCDAKDTQERTEMSREEIDEGFVPVFMTAGEAVAINEEYAAHEHNTMIERELRVLRIIADELCVSDGKERAAIIREAARSDLDGLLTLYMQLHDNPFPEKTDALAALWDGILADKNHHIIVAEENGRIVSSCVCVIVPNLTRAQRPYALIENVITDKDYRKRGLATDCLNFAKELAVRENCYKMMLLTGSKEQSTLDFYERAGYNKNDKTAFIRWL